jgi:hypothetical protein
VGVSAEVSFQTRIPRATARWFNRLIDSEPEWISAYHTPQQTSIPAAPPYYYLRRFTDGRPNVDDAQCWAPYVSVSNAPSSISARNSRRALATTHQETSVITLMHRITRGVNLG